MVISNTNPSSQANQYCGRALQRATI